MNCSVRTLKNDIIGIRSVIGFVILCTSLWVCVVCMVFLGDVFSCASKLISHATLALLFGVAGAESEGGGGTITGGGGGGRDKPSRESSEKSSQSLLFRLLDLVSQSL